MPESDWCYNDSDLTELCKPFDWEHGVYNAAKGGLINFTRYLAAYYGELNIRVNCISPGGISDNQPEIFKKKYRNSCSNYGLLKPEDVYETFKFILSKGSKYVNGQNIIIDDGWSL